MIGYPGLEDPALPRHLLGGGEGALYWYKRQPTLHLGVPNFDAPVFAMEHAPLVYAGSLPAPAVGDWDGDGAPDVLVGNSEGRVLFFKNLASDDLRLRPGAPVWAGGQAIHVQLSWAIQGPEEARCAPGGSRASLGVGQGPRCTNTNTHDNTNACVSACGIVGADQLLKKGYPPSLR